MIFSSKLLKGGIMMSQLRARDLGLTVLAEGVETDEQVRALREMGCDMIQGYRFFHPVPDWDARRQLLERELLQREEAIKIAARLKVETGASIVTFL